MNKSPDDYRTINLTTEERLKLLAELLIEIVLEQDEKERAEKEKTDKDKDGGKDNGA